MDDLISRQAAIDTIQKYKVEHGYAYFDCASEIENDIKNLPSAQPDVPDRNVGDMISRQVALKEIEEWISALYENAHHESASDGKMILNAIKHLPSAQPEPCEDAVSREAVSEWLKQYGQDVLHGKYKFSLMYIWKNLMELPPAQPDIIRCRDCKYWREHKYSKETKRYIPFCGFNAIYTKADDFCSRAERRTDEQTD